MSKSILILGDIVIDRSYYGNSTRIAPEGPIPIINISNKVNTLGCIGNIINNVTDFFDSVYTVICLDSDGVQIMKNLLPKKLKTKFFIQNDRNIIIKNRIFCNNKIISRFDEEKIISINADIETEINKYINNLINTIDIVIISDYDKGFLTDNILKNTINLCKERDIFVAIDPKGSDYIKYKNATLIKPNRKGA